MKTTDIFIEQVLIGFLVMLTGGMMFLDWIPKIFSYLSRELGSNLLSQIATGSVFVGAAYLIGIVYDRCADTLLGDLERHIRLRHAIKCSEREESHDHFPEDRYCVMMMAEEQKARDYADYLRSRIRLTRSLTTLIPGMSLSLLLLLLKTTCNACKVRGALWIGGSSILLVYLCGLGVKLGQGQKGLRGLIRGYLPPRTERLEEYKDYINYEDRDGRVKKGVWWFIWRDRFCWGLLALAGIGGFLVIVGARRGLGCLALASVPTIGILVALISGWSWWRISQSYFQHLSDYQKYKSWAAGANSGG